MTTEKTLTDMARYKADPWAFLTECIFTQDSVDQDQPVKAFPSHFEYLHFFTRLWQREKMLAVPKSRRMTMSWCCLALTLWDLLFHPGKQWAVVSKKEDDSAELVARIQFMYNRIPAERIPKALLPKIRGGKMTKSPPKIEFDFGNDLTSTVSGFPMGADQLRQFTFSGIFGDECAFWEVAEEFYTGAKPTTDGGGRMVLVSSRSPGFFKKIVFDQINNQTDKFPEIPPAKPRSPMQGVQIWKNPKNRFVVMDLHYSANPEKRSEAFKTALMQALPMHQFLREYERNWQTFAGMPVYPDFQEHIHCPVKRPRAQTGLPLLAGIDFGLTPAFILGQLQNTSLKLFGEMVSQNESIKTFFPKVLEHLRLHYPQWPLDQIIFFIDPAGFNRNENDERTCALEMQEIAPGIQLEPGPVAWERRREAVEHYLLSISRDGAGLEIDAQACPVLVEGFKGGYRYPDKMTEVEALKPRPIKNAYSHPHDALQYLADGARSKAEQHDITHIPAPQYNFNHTSRRNTYGY